VTGSVLAGVVGLELGALGVVLETTASGVTDLAFSSFLVVMLPIHLVIGVVEGVVTAAVVLFVQRAEPELLARSAQRRRLGGLRLRPVVIGLAVAALVAAGVLSWFASTDPDGLEWSIRKVTGVASDPTAASATNEDEARGAAGDEAGQIAQVDSSDVAGAVVVLAGAGALGFALRRRSTARRKAPA
jgi:hypothetical protein